MRTEEKSPVPRVRIAVLGDVHVGKSALTVRYLTRRFIGEYSSKTDLLYRQTVPFESGLLDVEIVDLSAHENDEWPVEQVSVQADWQQQRGRPTNSQLLSPCRSSGQMRVWWSTASRTDTVSSTPAGVWAS